jgi:hypothetical protein
MTLGNMRANGVRTLDVWCLGRGCHHHRVPDVSAMADDVAVRSIRPRLRCALRRSRCRCAAELVGVPSASPGVRGLRCREHPEIPATRTWPAATAESLSTPERVLLFCVASSTEWVRAGITPATVQHMIVRNLVERDAAGRLGLTEQGCAALEAMIPR